jgi:hypothetical protein
MAPQLRIVNCAWTPPGQRVFVTYVARRQAGTADGTIFVVVWVTTTTGSGEALGGALGGVGEGLGDGLDEMPTGSSGT